MIIVKPLEGLCNRMRVINSCIALHDRNPCAGKILMVWQKNASLNSDFSEILEPITNIKIVNSHRTLDFFLYDNSRELIPFVLRIKRFFLKYLLTNYKYYNTETISNFRFQNAYWDNAKNNFVIDTYSDFYNSADTNYYHLFKPVKPLQKLIEKQVARFLKPTTGIHIRRTDNIKSIQKSTTRLFIDMVTHLLEKDSNQLFYLSTDDFENRNPV